MKIKDIYPLDKPTLTMKQIAVKHKVKQSVIARELKMGIAVEMEHTSDRKVAREIALDHLGELPDYYTKLKKVEK